MNRLILGCALAILAGAMPHGAGAQTAAGDAAGDTTATATTKGVIAKPPPGMAPQQPKRLNHSNASVQGNNTPTLPQIALHPQATIGTPVPIAGPGGTTTSATGD